MRRFIPRNNLGFAWLAATICFCLIACEGKPISGALQVPQQTGPVSKASPQPGPAAPDEQEDKFEVTVLLNNPSPARGEVVTFIGMLEKNGLYLNGIMMEASWPGEAQERHEPSCVVQVVYQRGVCSIDTTNFAVDEFVPVTIKFRYNDKTITGETSFTVK